MVERTALEQHLVARAGTDLAPEDDLLASGGQAGVERMGELVQGGLGHAIGVEQPGLRPAIAARPRAGHAQRLVSPGALHEALDPGVAPREERRLGEPAGLDLGDDAVVGVGRVRLVAEVGEVELEPAGRGAQTTGRREAVHRALEPVDVPEQRVVALRVSGMGRPQAGQRVVREAVAQCGVEATTPAVLPGLVVAIDACHLAQEPERAHGRGRPGRVPSP